jgi:hypothetical protein
MGQAGRPQRVDRCVSPVGRDASEGETELFLAKGREGQDGFEIPAH